MNALVTGIAAFFIAALGALCPHDYVYVPALLSVIVAGGYVGGTIFSLQSEGVYDLRIRENRDLASLTGNPVFRAVASDSAWEEGIAMSDKKTY